MQSYKQRKIARRRSRRSKKADRGMASLKLTDDGPNMKKKASRRSRREARRLQVQSSFLEEESKIAFRRGLVKEKQTGQSSFRQRLNFSVLDTDGIEVPSCPHGPCLLFGRCSSSGEFTERFFGCAIYRSDRCNFRWPLESYTNSAASASNESHVEHRAKFQYGRIRKSVKGIATLGMELYYCAVCNDAVSLPHKDPVVGPLKRATFRKPTRLINAIVDDNGEAQYWFTYETIKVIANALTTNDCDGVLCIGAPTLFEYFRCSAQRRMSMKSFLLDFDRRFASFYQSSQFAQFSMLTNYFYDAASLEKFDAFLLSVRHLAIVCDPPFGVIVQSLFATINEIKRKFEKLRREDSCQVNLLVVLPIFVAKHVKHCDKRMEMVDYKVCYRNHSKYAKPEKSIVRMFTDFPLNKFTLPTHDGYRFCEICERYVSIRNRHCGLCGICPSKDGSPYHHCDRCSRCVKNTYRHCRKCSRCHLIGRCL